MNDIVIDSMLQDVEKLFDVDPTKAEYIKRIIESRNFKVIAGKDVYDKVINVFGMDFVIQSRLVKSDKLYLIEDPKPLVIRFE